MIRASRVTFVVVLFALAAAGPAVAARRATPQERSAITTAVRQGVQRRWHRTASGVHDVRVSSVGPWALARLNRPLFRVPNSIALLARVHGRWTLVASSVTGDVCAARCRVLDRSSDILGLVCRLRRLHSRRYLARVTCTTPLQRLSFILHKRV